MPSGECQMPNSEIRMSDGTLFFGGSVAASVSERARGLLNAEATEDAENTAEISGGLDPRLGSASSVFKGLEFGVWSLELNVKWEGVP